MPARKRKKSLPNPFLLRNGLRIRNPRRTTTMLDGRQFRSISSSSRCSCAASFSDLTHLSTSARDIGSAWGVRVTATAFSRPSLETAEFWSDLNSTVSSSRGRRSRHVGNNAPPFDVLRQSHFDREEPECRIAAFRDITPTIRQLRLALHLQPRRKRIACAVCRMAELELRHSALHPEPRNLEVVISIRRIYAKHKAFPNLAPVRRCPLKRRRLVTASRSDNAIILINPFCWYGYTLPASDINHNIRCRRRRPDNSIDPCAISVCGAGRST